MAYQNDIFCVHIKYALQFGVSGSIYSFLNLNLLIWSTDGHQLMLSISRWWKNLKSSVRVNFLK